MGQAPTDWTEQICQAIERNRAFPALGEAAYSVTNQEAYRVQRQVLDAFVKAGDEIVGHKAGLTNAAAQARFDMFEPVAGSLLKSQLKNTATFVPKRKYKGLMVEMEIGFELKLTIRSVPRSVEELKSKVRQVYPIVELPNLHYAPADQITGADIIATNVAAATVIKGRPRPVDSFDLNAVEATLTHNGEPVASGQGSDVMGDQWEALLWLVRNRLNKGYAVKRDDLLITGVMGKMVAVESGRYVADFGPLGKVSFTSR
jgi:2-keto-4-pentenoate hydratase